jgi:hypothetical protein
VTFPFRLSVFALAVGLAGCATYPSGPSMMALPGTGASFDQFRADDASCQAYAQQMIGHGPNEAAASSTANSAAVGTLLGAAAGAMIGAASGNPGAGAAIGGGSGLVLGGAAGSDAYATTGYRQQDRYDNAYIQCMYARGHQVPVPASAAAAYQQQAPAPYPGTPAPAPSPGTPTTPPVNPAPGSAYPPPGTAPPPGY